MLTEALASFSPSTYAGQGERGWGCLELFERVISKSYGRPAVAGPVAVSEALTPLIEGIAVGEADAEAAMLTTYTASDAGPGPLPELTPLTWSTMWLPSPRTSVTLATGANAW